MTEKEELVHEISNKKERKKREKKEEELQVIKLSPLGYYNFTRDVLIFGEKEA